MVCGVVSRDKAESDGYEAEPQFLITTTAIIPDARGCRPVYGLTPATTPRNRRIRISEYCKDHVISTTAGSTKEITLASLKPFLPSIIHPL
jgi:hypothetical protein